MSGRDTPAECANCGAEIPPRARSCPECGADEKTGWRETDAVDGLDLPGENFDYDSYVKREFSAAGETHVNRPWVKIVALVLLGLLCLGLVGYWV